MNTDATKYMPEFLRFLKPEKNELHLVKQEKDKDELLLEQVTVAEGIMPGCIIEGDITFNQKAFFNGEVQGSIISDSELILGEDCVVNGSVSGGRIVLRGEVQGDVHSTEILMLKKTAVVHGTITTSKISVETGAQINGSCMIDTNLSKALPAR